MDSGNESDYNSLFITQNTFKANIMDNSSDLLDEIDKFVNCFEKNQLNVTKKRSILRY